MGTWYKQPRPKLEHKCTNPHFMIRSDGNDIFSGDRYQCDCGKVWEVTSKIDAQAYDNAKGAWYIFYKEVHAHGVMTDTRLEK